MRKMTNTVHIEGWLYESKLEERVTGKDSKRPGTPFIRGSIRVATDNNMTNIVDIYFTYVAPKFQSRDGTEKDNPAYGVLSNIMSGVSPNVMAHGADKAVKLRIDTNIALNEFPSDRNGKEEWVTAKRLEGGFIHVVTDISEDEKVRNKFTEDMIIEKFRRIEADEEHNRPEKGIVSGFVFNWRNDLLPVEFSVTAPGAIDYFEKLVDDSRPGYAFTQLWGKIISETIINRRVIESAFGDDDVVETPYPHKDWVITGAYKEPYEWDSEDTITAAEMKEALAKREVAKAEIKRRSDEYRASRNGASAKAEETSNGGFDF